MWFMSKASIGMYGIDWKKHGNIDEKRAIASSSICFQSSGHWRHPYPSSVEGIQKLAATAAAPTLVAHWSIQTGSSHISLRAVAECLELCNANDTSPTISEQMLGCVWQVAMHLDVQRRFCALRRLDPQSPPSVRLPAAPSAPSIGQNHQTTKAWWKLQGTAAHIHVHYPHTKLRFFQDLSGALKVSLYSRPIISDRSFEVYCIHLLAYIVDLVYQGSLNVFHNSLFFLFSLVQSS